MGAEVPLFPVKKGIPKHKNTEQNLAANKEETQFAENLPL